MKAWKRILALTLAAVLLLLAPACSESAENSGDEKSDAAAPQTSAADAGQPETDAPEEMYVPDDLDGIDLGGATSRIFCWESWDPGEFFVEEDTGEIVVSAVFSRNITVEERLNVTLAWDEYPRNDAAYGSTLKNAVQNQNSAGDGTYDIVACYGMRIASCATDALLMNLYDGEHIDLSKPWYYESATKAGTLHKNYTYFTAGDLSYNALARMSGVFFNQKLVTDYNVEDPYDMVLEGVWTIDKMHEVIRDLYVDLDGDGKVGQGDQFGVMCAGDQIQTLYYGLGNHFIEHDADDTPILSDDIYSERTLTILEKYLGVFSEEAAFKNPNTDDPTIFDTGRALFYIYPLGHVSDGSLRDSDTTYGFIPQPKLNEQEDVYHASVTNAVTLFAIPLVIDSNERASAVFECLASEGYRQVSPVVFEQAYKAKYNYDDSARQSTIFDMIRQNAVFDLGKIFSNDLFSGFSNGVIGDFIWNNKTDYASQVQKLTKAWNKKMEKVTEKLNFGD
ncbi:MAG: hypothetical protein IKZ41_10705 [Clostridia bacterium]|nr:hypothetical protein [Clostridia bacterium]MBR5367561.1 hypothetical protein [Clostridia bacterium]